MPRTPFTAGSVTVLAVPHDPTAALAVAAKLADYVPNRRSALLRWSLVRVNEPGPNLYGRCERLDGCQTTRVPPTIERVEPVLNVRDVAASTKFYARLGFVEQFRDDPESPMLSSSFETTPWLYCSGMTSSGSLVIDPPCDSRWPMSMDCRTSSAIFPTVLPSRIRLGAPASSTCAMQTATGCSSTATCSAVRPSSGRIGASARTPARPFELKRLTREGPEILRKGASAVPVQRATRTLKDIWRRDQSRLAIVRRPAEQGA